MDSLLPPFHPTTHRPSQGRAPWQALQRKQFKPTTAAFLKQMVTLGRHCDQPIQPLLPSTHAATAPLPRTEQPPFKLYDVAASAVPMPAGSADGMMSVLHVIEFSPARTRGACWQFQAAAQCRADPATKCWLTSGSMSSGRSGSPFTTVPNALEPMIALTMLPCSPRSNTSTGMLFSLHSANALSSRTCSHACVFASTPTERWSCFHHSQLWGG